MEIGFQSSFSAEGVLIKAASLATEPLIITWGFEEKLAKLHQKLSLIQELLGDVSLLSQDRGMAVTEWVNKLQFIVNDADDLFDEMNYEVLRIKSEIQNHMKKKVLNFLSLSNPILFRVKMTHRIKSINKYLVDLECEASVIGLAHKKIDPTPQEVRRDRKTNELPATSEKDIIRREEVVSNIVEILTNSNINEETLTVIAIVGIQGLGKTTMARSIYNKSEINSHFDKKIWVCVSDTFDVNRILSGILESLNPRSVGIKGQDALLQNLQEKLTEKRCLLILDDVWNEDSELWNNMMRCLTRLNFARGTTIIVTTHSVHVASTTGAFHHCNLGPLSDDEIWFILKGVAFSDSSAPVNEDLEKVGREIAKKCAGVPLMAKVLGGMLRFGRSEVQYWTSVLESAVWDFPEGDDRIMSALKLSFDHLQSSFLKQCFGYCSMFRKGSEIERDNLIQLWMSQEFLHPSRENIDKKMEDIGNEFFNILLENSLLEVVKKDDFGIVSKCSLHDLVHDLVEMVSYSERLTWDSNEIHDKLTVRHAAHVPTSILERIPQRKVMRLRSLISNGEVPNNMLPFRALHVLNVYEADIEELPISIGKLKRLRYLNVSKTEIKALPKSIGKLHNLQTLRMQYCRNLKEFPKEVGDLVNLRHIYFDYVQNKRHITFGLYREFPVVIQKLTNLQTIPYFIVGRNQIGRGIEELEGLNQLKGELTIYDLEHVRDREEAKKANLVGKGNIRKLTLIWSKERWPRNNNEEEVLEGLQPHPELEILEIHNFMGAKFSSWKPLDNLKKILLLQCDVVEEVPMLAHLPNLMHLEFDTMINLKCVGVELYCYNKVDGVEVSIKKTETLFPSMKILRIRTGLNLIEWIKPHVRPTEEIMEFPCLEELALLECTRMRTIPNHMSSLRQLEISLCHELSSLPLKKCTSLENLEIRSCDNLTSISTDGLTSLRRLVITSCAGLTSLDLQSGPSLVSLEELSVNFCRSLESFPALHGCASLRVLCIANCDVLTRIVGSGLYSLPLLEDLTMRNCPSLEFIPITQGITSLRKWAIEGCPRMVIQDHAELSSLPGSLKFVQELNILNCPKLTCISIHWFPSLRKLLISSCGPKLSITSSRTLDEEEKLFLHDCVEHSQNLSQFSGDGLHFSIEVKLVSCPTLEKLSFQGCTSVGALYIEHCQNLKNLVNWQDTLSLLEDLTLRDCPNLELIPIVHGIVSLRELVIEGCEKLSDLASRLEYCTSLRKVQIRGCPSMTSIPISPSLLELFIEDCAELLSLQVQGSPVSLSKLTTRNCLKLTCISVDKWTSLHSLCIEDCQNLRHLADELNALSLLEVLIIRNCPNLELIPITSGIARLREMVIDGCEKLSSFPKGLMYCESLEMLTLSNCPKLTRIVFSDSVLPRLKLIITSCGLEELNITGSSINLEELSLQSCLSLRILCIEFCGHFTHLAVQSCTSLEGLTIVGCDVLVAIPSLDNLTSLDVLSISECNNLISLAEVDVSSMQSLSNLSIVSCQKLKYMPKGLHALTRLKKMEIGGFWEELDSFPDFEVPSQLEELSMWGWRKLKSLPQQILQCTSSLTKLSVYAFCGMETLPAWLGNFALLTFLRINECPSLLKVWNYPSLEVIPITSGIAHLREMVIDGCEKLTMVPEGIGHCESLEMLKISNCPSIELIPITSGIARLREMVIDGCEKLSMLHERTGYCASLEMLKISNCPKLTRIEFSDNILPRLKLVITSCGVEELIVKNNWSSSGIVNLEELSVQSCPSLRKLWVEKGPHLRHLAVQSCTSLQLLRIWHCYVLEGIPSLDGITSLQQVSISHCPNLISVADVHVSSQQSLSFLKIQLCEKLQYMPKGLHALTRLQNMVIGGFWEELDSFADFEVPSQLEELELLGWPKLESLPQQIQQCSSSLTKLSVKSFNGLESLPEWLGNFALLTYLKIDSCDRLRYLPSVEAMQRLTKLHTLEISRCPLLKERCDGERGPEWPKISHIINRKIDDK